MSYVIVKIWDGYLKSGIGITDDALLFLTVDSGSSYGHVAMLIHDGEKEIYISFWPGKCADWHTHSEGLCQEAGSHFHTENMDHLVEKHPANREIKLYS